MLDKIVSSSVTSDVINVYYENDSFKMSSW